MTKIKLGKEEFNELIDLKKQIFKILDAKNLNDAKNLQNQLLDKKYSKNNFTINIVDKVIIPNFQKLTAHLENTNIQSTNNKIKNIFQKVFPKHIKITMKIEQGILRRFILKLNHWNIKNKKINKVFERVKKGRFVKFYIIVIIE